MALASCLVFLQINGLLPYPDPPCKHIDAWEAMVLDGAASRIDRETTAARLKALLA